jgi:tetratricopeptide (TPR) repeat protein
MHRTSLLLVVLLILPFAAYAEETLLDRGIVEYRAENFEEAIVLLQQARQLEPASSLAAFYLGLAQKQAGDLSQALAGFRAAATGAPAIQDAYPELIECLYQRGEYDEARHWIGTAEKAAVRPAQVAFLKGLVLAGVGEERLAIEAFRAAAGADPSLSQAAGLQVAMLQAKERRLDEARQSLKALIALDPTTELATLAREYDSSFARLLGSYRPWHASVGLAYLYDDNVVAKPSIAVPGVEISGEQDSGMVAKVRVEYAPLLSGGRQFAAQYSLQSTTYGANDTHNTIIQSLALLPGQEFGRGAVTVPISYAHVLLQQENYLGLASVRPTLSLLTTGGQIAQFSAGYAWRELFKAPLARDEDRDGSIYSLGAGYLVPIVAGEGLVSLRYEFSFDNAIGSNWDNRGHRGSLGLLLPLGRGVKANLSGDIYCQEYLHDHTTFGVQRTDVIYSGTIGLTWALSRALELGVTYAYTRADSNIGIYDYRRNTVTTGFEFSF